MYSLTRIIISATLLVISYQSPSIAAEKSHDAVVNFDSGIGNTPSNEGDPDYQQYIQQYFSHYHALGASSSPPFKDFNAEYDAQGIPKWFDGDTGEYTLKMLVIRLYAKEQFDDLEKLLADWNNSKNRKADGKWKLVAFTNGLSMRFDNGGWDADYQIIKHWRQKYPQSAGAAIAESLYWSRYAWNARGSGFADSVSEAGWKLFKDRIEKAGRILVESESYASNNPEWFAQFLMVAKAVSWPKESLLKLSAKATQRHPYYYPIYYATLQALSPAWGGDWKNTDDFIRQSSAQTKDQEGLALYARLYMAASACAGCTEKFNLFRDTKASWPEMKKGFEDLIRQYPHSLWNLNKYASFACQAGDKTSYQAVRFRIGNNLIPGAWRSNYSTDLCDHQFPSQQL